VVNVLEAVNFTASVLLVTSSQRPQAARRVWHIPAAHACCADAEWCTVAVYPSRRHRCLVLQLDFGLNKP